MLMFRTLLSILLIIASILGIVLYAVPRYQGAQGLRTQVAELEEAFDNATRLTRVREELLTKRNNLDSANLQRLEELLPSHVDNVKLVSIDLERLAARHGLVLGDVTVQEAEEAVSDPTQSNNPLGTVLIDFSTEGSYGDFIDFLDDIEHSLRVIDVNTVTFDRNIRFDQTGQEIVTDFYEFNVTIATYWLRRNVAAGTGTGTTTSSSTPVAPVAAS
jgi:Tfp pilus assembly protein PilO